MNWLDYVNQHQRYGADPKVDAAIAKLIQSIRKRISCAATIWCFGNGGSATTAEHFATDLLLMGSRTGIECRALSLTSQVGSMTALANDFAYEEGLQRQLRAVVSSQDLVIGFSASGNSKNLVNALAYCKERDVESFCFLGFDGGSLLKSAITNYIYFSSEPKLYGLIENLHLIACHYVIDQLVAIDWTNEVIN